MDTGGNHADLTGDYASIPVEMKQVASELGVEFLRDADESAFYARLGEIRKKTGDRAVLRAMHFFDDNRLAQEEANALAEGNLDAFLDMEIRSGRSSFMRLQNVFACSKHRRNRGCRWRWPCRKNFWRVKKLPGVSMAAALPVRCRRLCR